MEELEERIGVMVEVLDMGTIMNKVAITAMMKMMAKITKYGNHSCNYVDLFEHYYISSI